MLDQVLSQEIEEVEALVAMLEDRPKEGGLEMNESTRSGSDDESYDSIFAEILSQPPEYTSSSTNVWQASNKVEEKVAADHDAMDTTF